MDEESDLFVLDSVKLFYEAVNNCPTDISLSSNIVAENQPVNTVVGTLSTTDADAGDSHTYALVAGTGDTDNASFNINGSQLRTSASFNYETKSSYSVRIRTDDGECNTYEEQFTITVNDVTEVVSFTINAISNAGVNENTAYTGVTPSLSGGTPIGTVSYSPGGADATDFTINPSTGVVSMAARNYESPVDANTDNVYEVSITATDQDGNNDSEDWTVTVNDVVEPATFTINAISDVSQAENTAYTSVTPAITGTPIGSISYTLEGADAGDFTVNPSTGVVSMAARDFEIPVDANTDNVYEVTLRATDDDGNNDTEDWTVTITDLTETATFTINAIADANVNENTAYTGPTPGITGTPVGSLTYTIEGADAGDFTVNPSTGVVSMAARNYESPVDANTDNVYEVTLRATDGDGNFTTEAWTVTVNDVVETASFTINAISNVSLPENTAYTGVIPAITGTPIGSVTWTLESADAGDFTVNPNTGVVSMAARDFEAPVDANTDNVYEVTLRATDDDGNNDTEDWTVTITDVTGEGPPEVVGVMDLSYSMNRDFDDYYYPADTEEVKLHNAKDGLIAFIDLLFSFNENNVGLALTRFPNSPQLGCDAGGIQLIQNLDATYHTNITNTIIPNLIADGGSTPLLEGINFAASMFTSDNKKVIVLLSDGRHNCSSVTGNDLTNIINALNVADSIKLYTIGFGSNTMVPNDMLSTLATGTGGVHYNIATTSGKAGPAYDPTNAGAWDPSTALHAAYANIIIDGLDLSSSTDPLGLIDRGTVKQFKVPVTLFDKKVCFFISWKSNQQNNLNIRLYKPDSTELSLQQPGITVIRRESHSIITLHEEILAQSGMLGLWTLAIDASNALAETEHYQYSVINASKNLQLKTWFDKKKYYTGDKMKIYLELLVDNQRLVPIDKITIHGTQPGEGLGTWLSSREVTREQLRKVQEQQGNIQMKYSKLQARETAVKRDSLQRRTPEKYPDPIHSRALVLMQEYKLEYPKRVKIDGLTFNDEGKHGDEQAGDGLYTAMLKSLTEEGSYEFYLAVSDTGHGKLMQRDGSLQTYVNVKINVKKFIAGTELYMVAPDGRNVYMITLSLKDGYGNIPSPEVLGSIGLSVDKGELMGGIMANPDGTFAQKVILDKNIKPGKVKMTIKIDDRSGSQKLVPKPIPWKIIIIIIIIILLLILAILRKKK